MYQRLHSKTDLENADRLKEYVGAKRAPKKSFIRPMSFKTFKDKYGI